MVCAEPRKKAVKKSQITEDYGVKRAKNRFFGLVNGGRNKGHSYFGSGGDQSIGSKATAKRMKNSTEWFANNHRLAAEHLLSSGF